MTPLAIITATMPLITKLIDYVQSLRTIARQTGELTPEEDAALDARIAALSAPAKPEHWRIPD